MDIYSPFLLPLLPTRGETDSIVPPMATSPARSPIEEEQRIAKLPGNPEDWWKQLQDRIPDVYGLPLIVDWKSGVRRPGRDDNPGTGDLDRFLILTEGETRWFLIEHPSDIDLFDQYAGASDRVAVARPSLFARLWRESELPSPPDLKVEETAGRKNDHLALQRFLEGLLQHGNPSDWHLEPDRNGFRSRLRIHGKLAHSEALPKEKGIWLQNALRRQAGIDETPSVKASDGRLAIACSDNPITLRLSFVPVLYGQAMVARFQYSKAPQEQGLASLGLDPGHMRWILSQYAQPEGLWLVVGPTGSGKTTTLYALIGESVRQQEKILTAEDPVEHVLEGTQQVSLDPARGLTYATVMRAFLRQAPDTILIGEIRDEETAAIAAQAGRSGHRVLSTVHARSDSGVIRRLQDLGQDPGSMKPILKLVLHQRLLPRLCRTCRSWVPVQAPLSDLLASMDMPPPESLARAAGCAQCQSGYDGRIAIFSSGRFFQEPDVTWQLLQSAWPHVSTGALDLRDCLPLIPAHSTRLFQLCHS